MWIFLNKEELWLFRNRPRIFTEMFDWWILNVQRCIMY